MVYPFANHGTLTLHAELSEQENTESLKKITSQYSEVSGEAEYSEVSHG